MAARPRKIQQPKKGPKAKANTKAQAPRPTAKHSRHAAYPGVPVGVKTASAKQNPTKAKPSAKQAIQARALAQEKAAKKAGQRAPVLVMACSLLIACCIGFGGTNWIASAEEIANDTIQGDKKIIESSYYQETIGSYEAISQSENADRAVNLQLAAEAINGYVIEPGATFSFNAVVGETSPERGYRKAPVLFGGKSGIGDGGGICQVSTALYIAAVRADMEIVERWPHSAPSDYAPIGLDATIVYGQRDLVLKNNTNYPVTIYAKAVGQKVTVTLLGKPRNDGITIDATSQVVDRYEGTAADGSAQQFYVSESFRIYYKDGIRQSRDLLSSDIYEVDKNSPPVLAEGSVDPNK